MIPQTNKVQAVDLFCGAGGTSTGLARACAKKGVELDLLAVNHWEVAIATHSQNHPHVRHLCESLDSINPRRVMSGDVDLLIASPECTHHSIARGGRPKSEQSRASAWHVVRWAEALRPRSILIENVREFRTWGPLGEKGDVLKSRRGETYEAFIGALKSLGYTVEDRVLNAAHYGDPTSRERLFIQARRGRDKPVWPEITHMPQANGKPAWRTAREIIDWSLPGKSIFNRKRPLAPATLRRIEAGLKKFCGKNAKPFLIILRNNQNARTLDAPLPTITAGGIHAGLVHPFIVPFFGERKGQDPRTHSVDDPLPAVTSHGAGGLVQPFILPHRMYKQMDVGSVDRPLRAGTASNGAGALVQPFLVKYYGTAKTQSINLPLGTVTSKGRFALVQPDNTYQVDILFRMLKPHELAAAMGFGSDYQFTGTQTDQVRQIGNAVPVGLAEALCTEMI